ncbi:LOW QUALITY PROTEIN: hypothetical protein CVT25_011533 [Psilocybe cyanescens]|uniref:Uncharacterized protein n=1 Tax=Psilocybe cyanescens TaxID=93625 RepID=A0A409XWI4_PSICY|nr:LOW QUALITY PROTEIN: hypothetical protein CVT25_011533 [Psilocybe cyanescens]
MDPKMQMLNVQWVNVERPPFAPQLMKVAIWSTLWRLLADPVLSILACSMFSPPALPYPTHSIGRPLAEGEIQGLPSGGLDVRISNVFSGYKWNTPSLADDNIWFISLILGYNTAKKISALLEMTFCDTAKIPFPAEAQGSNQSNLTALNGSSAFPERDATRCDEDLDRRNVQFHLRSESETTSSIATLSVNAIDPAIPSQQVLRKSSTIFPMR